MSPPLTRRYRSIAWERPRAVGTGAPPASLSHHEGHLGVPVEVRDAHSGQLPGPYAGGDQQPDDGRVAPGFAGPAIAHREEPAQVLGADDGNPGFGNGRGLHPGHRASGDLTLFHQVLEQLGEAPVPLVGGGRHVALDLVQDEGLDVLAVILSASVGMPRAMKKSMSSLAASPYTRRVFGCLPAARKARSKSGTTRRRSLTLKDVLSMLTNSRVS